MLKPAVSPFRKRRRRVRRKPAAIVAPLTLVSAAYDAGGPAVTLTFDRAVDVSAFSGGDVLVDDATFNGMRYTGEVAEVEGPPTVVRVLLTDVGDDLGAGVTLTATAGNGIVAAGDGAAWAGVTDLGLPWP